jgi:serine/threonine protein kinase
MAPQPTMLAPLRGRDPARIGGYVLLARLGAGAMGRVYLGRSTAGRLVAVKTIRLELAEEPDFRARFAHEVAAARRVSGVFTAAVVAADPDAEVPWLATAYVPAPSLDRLVQACGPLPVPSVRWLAAGCAEALESIHEAGLVHRDLKPSNVLVSPDGARVIDFGVARAVERISLTATRGAVGTPAYMAPEQARDTRRATAASDIFSLGATLLFAVTGHAPYQGETVMDVLVRLATEPPDFSGMPTELADVVTGCLARDPGKRPTSAMILEYLAPYVNSADPLDGHESGPAFLPETALDLIDEYRHRTQPPARVPDEVPPDTTFGSQVSLPGPEDLPLPAGRWPATHLGRSHPRAGYAAASLLPGSQRVRRTVAAVAAAAALATGGGLLGAWLSSGASPAAVSTLSARRQPGGPPAGPPPLPGQQSPGVAGQRQLILNQMQGDGYTTYVVSGRGLAPFAQVTVRLAGVNVPVATVFTDRAGAFNYVINQGLAMFHGPIPPGTYNVVVTAGGGQPATYSFEVDP